MPPCPAISSLASAPFLGYKAHCPARPALAQPLQSSPASLPVPPLLPGSGNSALVLTLASDAHWEMRMFPAPLWLTLFFKGKLGEMRIGDKRFHQVVSFPSPLSRAPAHTTIIISSDFCSFLGSDYNFYRPARGLY